MTFNIFFYREIDRGTYNIYDLYDAHNSYIHFILNTNVIDNKILGICIYILYMILGIFFAFSVMCSV